MKIKKCSKLNQSEIRLSCGACMTERAVQLWIIRNYIYFQQGQDTNEEIYFSSSFRIFIVCGPTGCPTNLWGRLREFDYSDVRSIFIFIHWCDLELWCTTTLRHTDRQTDGYQLHTAPHYKSLLTFLICNTFIELVTTSHSKISCWDAQHKGTNAWRNRWHG